MAGLFADGYAAWVWLTTPRPSLDGAPPLTLLARGEVERVAEAGHWFLPARRHRRGLGRDAMAKATNAGEGLSEPRLGVRTCDHWSAVRHRIAAYGRVAMLGEVPVGSVWASYDIELSPARAGR